MVEFKKEGFGDLSNKEIEGLRNASPHQIKKLMTFYNSWRTKAVIKPCWNLRKDVESFRDEMLNAKFHDGGGLVQVYRSKWHRCN